MRWASDSSFPNRAVFGNRGDTGWSPMAACITRQNWSQMRKRACAYTIITYIFNVSLLVIISDFSISPWIIVLWQKCAHCGSSTSWWSSSRQWWSSSSWSAPSLFMQPVYQRYNSICTSVNRRGLHELFVQQVNYSSPYTYDKVIFNKSMNSVIIGYNLFKCFVYVPSRKFASELWTF